MAIKVIAQRREVKLGKNPGKKFVMRPDLYIPIQEKKVFAEASTHSGRRLGMPQVKSSARGPLRVTRSPCPDWEPCASAFARRRWLSWRT